MWKPETIKAIYADIKASMADDTAYGLNTGNVVTKTVPSVGTCGFVNKLYNHYDVNLNDVDAVSGLNYSSTGMSYTEHYVAHNEKKVRTVRGQKVGKFLNKFTNLRSDQIAEFCHLLQEETYYLVYAKSDFRKLYVHQYEHNCTGSCMDYAATHFRRRNPNYDSKVDPIYREYLHPMDLYETNDGMRLALLCKGNPEKWEGEGCIAVARALIARDKGYARVYANNSNHSSMLTDMLDEIFEFNSNYMSGMEFQCEYDNRGEAVVPYFDPENQRYDIDGTTVTINNSEGDYKTRHGDASPEIVDQDYCCICEDYHSDSECSETVYDETGYEEGSAYGSCTNHGAYVAIIGGGITYEDNAVYSDYEEEYLLTGKAREMFVDGDKQWVRKDGSSWECRLMLVESYDCCEYADEESVIQTNDGDYYLIEHQKDLYYRCAINGEYYPYSTTQIDTLENAALTINVDNLEINE